MDDPFNPYFTPAAPLVGLHHEEPKGGGYIKTTYLDHVKLDEDPPKRNLPTDSAERKRYPMCTGFIDYFSDAMAEVAYVSWVGNQKHNPGEELHWARGKSMDHADCVARHLTERGGFDVIWIDGVEHKIRHTAALAWRAMALLQQELEAEKNLKPPRGAR